MLNLKTIKIQSPNCPFQITNLEAFEYVNMQFTDLDLIFIKDVRANENNNHYKELNHLERENIYII